MADTMDSENAAFWLPTHFLTDDDFLTDLTSHKNNNSFSLDSPVSSTETELGDNNNNVNNDDDDDFLAELTRQLAHSTLQDSPNSSEKPWVFSTSPQSTLSGFGPWSTRSGFSSNGSPNGPSSRVPSPPITPPPKNDAAWELLYEAAGQVARLKINALAAQAQAQVNQQNRGLLVSPRNVSLPSKPHQHHHHHHRHVSSFYDFPPEFQVEQQVKRQGNGNYYCQHQHQHHHNNNQQQQQQQRRSCGGGPLGLPQSAWPSLRPNQHRQPTNGPGMRAVYLNGPGSGSIPKRQSTGTGVFLPRRAGTTHQPPPPEPRKEPTVLLPARVVQALNLDIEEMNNGNSHSRFGSGLFSERDMLMARRNAILEQRRKNLTRNEATATMVGHDIRLPSDWTY